VEELETAIERTEKHYEEDAEDDRREVRDIGSGLGAHEANAMLERT
jgi:hypothetical protein